MLMNLMPIMKSMWWLITLQSFIIYGMQWIPLVARASSGSRPNVYVNVLMSTTLPDFAASKLLQAMVVKDTDIYLFGPTLLNFNQICTKLCLLNAKLVRIIMSWAFLVGIRNSSKFNITNNWIWERTDFHVSWIIMLRSNLNWFSKPKHFGSNAQHIYYTFI